jgi:tRNA pseudouridine55 synthase
VTVYEFTVTALRPVKGDGEVGELLDVDATVRCSSGTYIRALARDLGVALGTGGHLTRLRRTRVGGYGLEAARTLEQLAERFEMLPLAQAASAAFPRRNLSADEARRLAHGGRLTAAGPAGVTGAAGVTGVTGVTGAAGAAGVTGVTGVDVPAVPATPEGPMAAYAPDGTLIALVTEESGQARPLVVFA